MSEFGWQMQRTPDGSDIVSSDAFLMRCFSIIAETKNMLMLEARNKRNG